MSFKIGDWVCHAYALDKYPCQIIDTKNDLFILREWPKTPGWDILIGFDLKNGNGWRVPLFIDTNHWGLVRLMGKQYRLSFAYSRYMTHYKTREDRYIV